MSWNRKNCPYLLKVKGDARICNASITMLVPSRANQTSYCFTEDYDICPTFLSHILREGGMGELTI